MSQDPQTSTLKLAYEDTIRERDRLRAARGSAVQLLGPLPASAAIAIGLFGSLGNRVPTWSLILAVVLLAVMVLMGIVYDNFPPYRVLRAQAEAALGQGTSELGHNRGTGEAEWLRHAIDVERRVYGVFSQKHTRWRKWACAGSTLQEYYEAERTGGYLVRIAFVLIIIDLVVGALIRQ